jgi:ectoine hydroxylase-related dioxygenase (phytanoyl-CoA dioxygenase family)
MTKLNLKFGPPPSTKFEVHPTAKEVQFFEDNGYLVVQRLTTDEEIRWIRQIFEFIFSKEHAKGPRAPVDRSGTLEPGQESKLSQAFHPEIEFPELLTTNHWRNAKRYAAALLGVEASTLSSWGHMIRKPPGGKAALWHQDHAYWQPELDYYALGVWLPMHDVTTEMGAMQFIPGSHKRGLLRHHHGDQPQHNVLEVDEPFDVSKAVACPLKMGGATFHHSETLHYTAPNTTDTPRLAFPMEFQITPVRRSVPVSMPWMDEFRKATGGGDKIYHVADGRISEI